MEALIYDCVRTPRGKGKKDGSLHGVTPLRLAETALRALATRNRLDTGLIDDVLLGWVEPVGEQGACIGRSAALAADYAESVAGVQVNRFCTSALEACNMAVAQVMAGQSDLLGGGGVEFAVVRQAGKRRCRDGFGIVLEVAAEVLAVIAASVAVGAETG